VAADEVGGGTVEGGRPGGSGDGRRGWIGQGVTWPRSLRGPGMPSRRAGRPGRPGP
jgi:hypothetical protein